MNMYNRALIIGKFMPLHRGHMKMIEHAAEIARLVDVVVLGWKGEPISMIQRYNWVSDTYVDVSYIHPILLGYDPNELNSSSESDLQSSIEWAEYLKANLYDFDKYDVIVGSEKYVQYMGEYLGIDYDIFSPENDSYIVKTYDVDNFRKEKIKNELFSAKEKVTLDNLFSQLSDGDLKELIHKSNCFGLY